MAADSSRSRPAWLPLVAATILVPTVLAGLTLLWPRPQIETDLSRTANEALSAAGFTDAGITLAGRDATITGVPAADQQRAVDAVQAVEGIRVAGISDAGAPGAGTPGAGTPGAGTSDPVQAQPFGIARRGEDIVLTGVVGSEQERAALVAAATAQAGGRAVVDELTVTPGAAPPAGADVAAVGAASAFLAGPGGTGLAVGISADGITLTGTVADAAAKAAAEAAVAAALPGRTVTSQLAVGAVPGSGGTSPMELDAAAKQQLQAGIDRLLAGSPITFGPNSPQLTPAGSATVARVLELVRPVAGARLQLDGFVASGPGDGRLTAQELSDQRAATVRDALVAGGVPADRIVARGLGEDPNPGDRAAGRRVTITVA